MTALQMIEEIEKSTEVDVLRGEQQLLAFSNCNLLTLPISIQSVLLHANGAFVLVRKRLNCRETTLSLEIHTGAIIHLIVSVIPNEILLARRASVEPEKPIAVIYDDTSSHHDGNRDIILIFCSYWTKAWQTGHADVLNVRQRNVICLVRVGGRECLEIVYCEGTISWEESILTLYTGIGESLVLGGVHV